MIESARDFLEAVSGGVQPPASEQRPASYDRPVRLATIEPYYTAGLPKVLFDGEAVVGSKGYAWDGKGGYAPMAGERVFLIPVGQSYVIGGPIATSIPFSRQIPLPFLLGTSQYPSGYDAASFTKSSAGIVIAKGLISVPAGGLAAGAIVGTLPPGFRPDQEMVFGTSSNAQANTIRVGTDGTLTLVSAVVGNDWYSLAGIRFPAAGVATWSPVGAFGATGPELARFATGFKASTLYPVGYWVDPYGFVWWKGAAELTTAGPVGNAAMIALDPSLRVLKESHFTGAGRTGTTWGYAYIGGRSTDGINWKSGPTAVGGLLSLDQLVIPTAAVSGWASASYINAWVNFDGGASYTAGRYTKRPDGIVVLQGLIRSGTLVSGAFAMPAGYRPTGESLRAATSSDAFGRLDIHANGVVNPYATSNNWFSLDGHMFAAEA